MLNLRSAANVDEPTSLSGRMRARRLAHFQTLLDQLPGPVSIIDLGGTVDFWRNAGWLGREGISITAVNLSAEPQAVQNVNVVRGDATDLRNVADNQYDVAFSNSVIEHLFTLDAQRRMAREARRVAKAYWIQTPSFSFPMEPHFHVPGWHWLPRDVRVMILRKRRCGWRGPCPDINAARAAVDEVRLMTKPELRDAFPGTEIWHETWMGMTKSYVAYDGFGRTIEGSVTPEIARTQAQAA